MAPKRKAGRAQQQRAHVLVGRNRPRWSAGRRQQQLPSKGRRAHPRRPPVGRGHGAGRADVPGGGRRAARQPAEPIQRHGTALVRTRVPLLAGAPLRRRARVHPHGQVSEQAPCRVGARCSASPRAERGADLVVQARLRPRAPRCARSRRRGERQGERQGASHLLAVAARNQLAQDGDCAQAASRPGDAPAACRSCSVARATRCSATHARRSDRGSRRAFYDSRIMARVERRPGDRRAALVSEDGGAHPSSSTSTCASWPWSTAAGGEKEGANGHVDAWVWPDCQRRLQHDLELQEQRRGRSGHLSRRGVARLCRGRPGAAHGPRSRPTGFRSRRRWARRPTCSSARSATAVPRIAALSFARKLFKDPNEKEEGVRVVKYKIFAFMERAKQTTSVRYAADTLATSSATANPAYHTALLVAVYQYSHEGFVHLDATLRNFVDLYGKALPRSPTAWAVKVIDVEDKHFRRLCPEGTAEWRYLLLFNLMVVLVFLKVSLAGRWDGDMLWRRVRHMCNQLRGELEGRGHARRHRHVGGRVRHPRGLPGHGAPALCGRHARGGLLLGHPPAALLPARAAHRGRRPSTT